MRKKIVLGIFCALLFMPFNTVHGYQLPPLNFGLTNVLDQPPGPGLYLFEYIQAYGASDFTDGNGDKIFPGEKIDFLLAFNQLIWVSKHKVVDGFFGLDFIQPVITINTNGAFLSANPNHFGDPVIGPFIQWFGHKLFGLPYLHRFELDFTLPLGEFNKSYTLNPGSNIWTVEPYYAFTLFITPKFSTSWRIHYTYNGENDDTKVKPGQAFHFNYSLEYEVVKDLRFAVAGYYLKQLSESESNGTDIPNSKEQVFAIGPALFWSPPGKLVIGLKTAFESNSENRPEGTRTTLRFIWKF
jgi:hypothetical protein